MDQILAIHTRSRGTYVERRVHAELAALSVHVGRNEGRSIAFGLRCREMGVRPSTPRPRNTGERTSAVRFELLAG